MDEIISLSETETYELGRSIGEKASPGDIFLLDGDLGVGKTVFAKGFAAGLGIQEPVTSPTFTIVCEYEGRLPLYHFDLYRIGDPDELYDIGYEEYFYGDGVSLVEWPRRLEWLKPTDAKTVMIEKVPEEGTDYRRIRIGEGS